MSNVDRVQERFGGLKYMKHRQATYLRDFITRNDCKDILEIGFYHGKSSAYVAAILEDLDRGHLTTIDKTNARERDPNIDQVLAELGLAHRVTPIYAERSFTWELGKLLRRDNPPQFDLCYFDGGHTWDVTGFGFLLVDMLLRPGGWIIFDDINWTIEKSLKANPKLKFWRDYSSDEKATPAVRMVFDMIAPRLGYSEHQIVRTLSWGIARKPFEAPMSSLPIRRPSLLDRLLSRIR